MGGEQIYKRGARSEGRVLGNHFLPTAKLTFQDPVTSPRPVTRRRFIGTGFTGFVGNPFQICPFSRADPSCFLTTGITSVLPSDFDSVSTHLRNKGQISSPESETDVRKVAFFPH